MRCNMLPFELGELLRYGASILTVKVLALRWSQGRPCGNADGMIFLSHYAHDAGAAT